MRWDRSHSPAAQATTTSATNSWSPAIEVTPRSTWSLPTKGSSLTERGVVENRRSTIACSTRNTPTDATTLASGGACRRGRNTSRCSASPSSTAQASATASAGQNCMLGPNDTWVGRSGRSSESSAWNRCTAPSTSASGFGSGGRNRSPSLRSAVYTYATYMATPPFARLMTPDPR